MLTERLEPTAGELKVSWPIMECLNRTTLDSVPQLLGLTFEKLSLASEHFNGGCGNGNCGGSC